MEDWLRAMQDYLAELNRIIARLRALVESQAAP
jgi:hypothetical protein